MISAATGAVALVIAPLVREHGLDHLIAAVILAGVFQVVLGLLGVARLMRFIPRSVVVGFVNALAILIFTAQLPHLRDVPWVVYAMVAVGIAVMVFLPRLFFPNVPMTCTTLRTIAPCTFAVALVGLMEL